MIGDLTTATAEQQKLIQHCTRHLETEYQYLYGSQVAAPAALIAPIVNQTLGAIAQCDAPYHNLEHTLQVVLVGKEIMQGKVLCGEHISSLDWLNFIVALLCHDIGYVKGCCPADHLAHHSFATGTDQDSVRLPEQATGASLTPYHVDRGKQFVKEVLTPQYPQLNAAQINQIIEFTRFPVPAQPDYQDTHSLPGLARAADLIGQLADPIYLKKLPNLFQEFKETGASQAMGYTTANDLRAGYPRFYWQGVSLYLKHGVRYLEMSRSGMAILENLYANRITVEKELDYYYGVRTNVVKRFWQWLRHQPFSTGGVH